MGGNNSDIPGKDLTGKQRSIVDYRKDSAMKFADSMLNAKAESGDANSSSADFLGDSSSAGKLAKKFLESYRIQRIIIEVLAKDMNLLAASMIEILDLHIAESEQALAEAVNALTPDSFFA